MGRNIVLFVAIALIFFFIGFLAGSVATLKTGIILFQKIAHVEFTPTGQAMIEEYFGRTGGGSLLAYDRTQLPSLPASIVVDLPK
jgi:hypothetical protein